MKGSGAEGRESKGETGSRQTRKTPPFPRRPLPARAALDFPAPPALASKTVRIEKWYLDGVTPDGAGTIGYAARITAGPLAARCAAILRWPADGGTPRQRFAWGGALPRATAEGVVWQSGAVDAAGVWRRTQPALDPIVLHQEAAGRIEWSCLCPSAQVAGRADAGAWTGVGYAERLVLTLPAARLPLRELRWGRFIADGESCVWIEWPGTAARRWFFHNGVAAGADAGADGREFRWGGCRLRLEPGTTLRQGVLLDTAFAGAGLLRWCLPRSIRRGTEAKWCSAGVLTDGWGCDHPGWAIHEVVHFP